MQAPSSFINSEKDMSNYRKGGTIEFSGYFRWTENWSFLEKTPYGSTDLVLIASWCVSGSRGTMELFSH